VSEGRQPYSIEIMARTNIYPDVGQPPQGEPRILKYSFPVVP
jgi:hypothetical protein